MMSEWERRNSLEQAITADCHTRFEGTPAGTDYLNFVFFAPLRELYACHPTEKARVKAQR